MFQIGALIVFCGLLAQTTALLEAVPSPLDPTLPSSMIPDMEVNIPDVPGSLSSALSHGLLSEGLLGSLENLPLSDALKAEGVTSRGLFRGLLGKMVSAMPFLNILDAKITNPMLDLGLARSPRGRHLYVTIPLGMTLNVNVPLVGSLLKLFVKLNITAELLPLTDKQHNIQLVLGSCTHSAGSPQISLPDRWVPVPFRCLSERLSKILPGLVQDKVPLLTEVPRILDTRLVEATVDKMVCGLDFPIKV
uniref:BPI fold-containing family A member 1 n=1 Tax=Equus caballus TaxID=9796 RepID=A0A5F5PKG3_HORSE